MRSMDTVRTHERFIFSFKSGYPTPSGDGRGIEVILLELLKYLGSKIRCSEPLGRIAKVLSTGFCVVEMPPRTAELLRTPPAWFIAEFNSRFPGVGYSREGRFRQAMATPIRVICPTKAGSKRPKQKLKLRIEDQTAQPVVGALVKAFENFAGKKGDTSRTDGLGRVELALGSPTVLLEHLSVELASSVLVYCRSALKEKFSVRDLYPSRVIRVDTSLDLRKSSPFVLRDGVTKLEWCDSFRKCWSGVPGAEDGAGVVVALIDSGVDASHPFFVNTQIDEVTCYAGLDDLRQPLVDSDYHGTHLAGMIVGLAGRAPAATLRSFKVYRRGHSRAKAGDIAEAIGRAVNEQPATDIINLSMYFDANLHKLAHDPAIVDAIRRARAKGAIVIAAAGNGYRRPVSYPGQDLNALAVSAFGVRHAYPPDADDAAQEARPYSEIGSRSYFMARLSNIGPKVAFAGPGVGVISATLGGGMAVYSGTSQACAAVTAWAACLLAKSPSILEMDRNWDRSAAIEDMLKKMAVRLGFSLNSDLCPFEGHGSFNQ